MQYLRSLILYAARFFLMFALVNLVQLLVIKGEMPKEVFANLIFGNIFVANLYAFLRALFDAPVKKS